MRLTRPLLSLRRRLAALGCDERGVSAVEFALVLPLMVSLYLGGVEVTQAISIDRKVEIAARTIADLVTRRSNITNAEMTNILNAAASTTAPYPVSNLKLKVSSIKIDEEGKTAKVVWSEGLHTAARAKDETVTLPSVYLVPNRSVVWVEASYDHKPAIGYIITGTITLKEQGYWSPRGEGDVTRSAS